MDLSKLPKLSDTKTAEGETPVAVPAEPVAALPVTPPVDAHAQSGRPPPAGLADTWLSIGVGAFILLFWPRFLQWASSKVFHTHFVPFTDSDGAVVPYHTLPEFWSDLGPTLLGAVLVIDGLLLFTRRPALILIALAMTLVSTLFNLGWVVYSYGTFGLAPLSLLAVIFGGFILSTQWATYQAVRTPARRLVERGG